MSKRKKLIDILKEKYKLVILNNRTFEEKASFRASLWYLVMATSAFAIVLIFLTILIIKITPLKEYVSGISTDTDFKRNIVESYTKVDSLEKLVAANAVYLENLQNVIDGRVGEKVKPKKDSQEEQSLSVLNQKVSKEELELRKLIESESQFDLSAQNLDEGKKGALSFVLFTPVRGKISAGFDKSQQHYAIDVVAKKNENIKAVLDGTVILSSFTSETGYVIGIQHANNMLSFYKHCSALLKKAGAFVRAGEVIAVIGNTGEYTTGAHLHFELWVDGNPVNPEDYMTF